MTSMKGEWAGGDPARRLVKMDDFVRRALVLAGAKVQFRIVAIMQSEAPGTIATGQTIRNIGVSRVGRGFIAGHFSLFVNVGPRTKYAKWGIGKGRAPGKKPPLKAIHAWVVEKPGGSSLPVGAQWAIARSVQRTIALRGTEEYNVLERALAIERGNVASLIRAGIKGSLSG
jgi:hypothetical protein